MIYSLSELNNPNYQTLRIEIKNSNIANSKNKIMLYSFLRIYEMFIGADRDS